MTRRHPRERRRRRRDRLRGQAESFRRPTTRRRRSQRLPFKRNRCKTT